nr:hypothetical protein [Methylomarinum sp. Ch1-1]MDP4521376.1 hypothetical protein [Methylomarinum sp. Ch1-1]
MQRIHQCKAASRRVASRRVASRSKPPQPAPGGKLGRVDQAQRIRQCRAASRASRQTPLSD